MSEKISLDSSDRLNILYSPFFRCKIIYRSFIGIYSPNKIFFYLRNKNEIKFLQ